MKPSRSATARLRWLSAAAWISIRCRSRSMNPYSIRRRHAFVIEPLPLEPAHVPIPEFSRVHRGVDPEPGAPREVASDPDTVRLPIGRRRQRAFDERADVGRRVGHLLPRHVRSQPIPVVLHRAEDRLGVVEREGPQDRPFVDRPRDRGIHEASRRRGSRLLFLLQDAAQDLADQRLRERVAELDLAWDAVAGQPLLRIAAPRDDLLRGRGLALLQDDERLHPLAGLIVGHADHRTLQDLRVTEQHLLDLGRVHVEPGHQDHVLHAVDDVEVAVLVHHRDVAGVQPAVADHLGRRLGPVPVARASPAGRGCRAPRAPRPAARGRDRRGRRSCSPCPAAGSPIEPDAPLALQRVRVRHRRALGQAVPLDDLRAARDPLELLRDGQRQRRRARDARLDRAQVVLARLRPPR